MGGWVMDLSGMERSSSSAVRLLLDRLEDPHKPRDKVVIAGKLENG